jgi:hypothetical protein
LYRVIFLTLLTGLRLRGNRRVTASLAARRIRILPMNQHTWWLMTFGMKGSN